MTKDEYEAKYQANMKFSGHGLSTKTHMPCPACAEPDFAEMPVIDALTELSKGATCAHCGRGFKAIVIKKSGVTDFKMVQTQGAPVPDYLNWIRRVDESH